MTTRLQPDDEVRIEHSEDESITIRAKEVVTAFVKLHQAEKEIASLREALRHAEKEISSIIEENEKLREDFRKFREAVKHELFEETALCRDRHFAEDDEHLNAFQAVQDAADELNKRRKERDLFQGLYKASERAVKRLRDELAQVKRRCLTRDCNVL